VRERAHLRSAQQPPGSARRLRGARALLVRERIDLDARELGSAPIVRVEDDVARRQVDVARVLDDVVGAARRRLDDH